MSLKKKLQYVYTISSIVISAMLMFGILLSIKGIDILTDTLDSKNVESAVKFLGYKIDKENTVAKDLGMYQLEMGLPVTYVLDKATVSAINLEIYNDMINNDRALTAGYLSLLS